MTEHSPTDHASSLIEQVRHIAAGLAQTFAPFCDVVVHDLRDPGNAAARAQVEAGGPGQVVANYPTQLPDGRPAKRTAIGIRDAAGNYVAALCLNVDLTQFRALQGMLDGFTALGAAQPGESPDPVNADGIRRRIDAWAARLAASPHSLKAHDRRALMRELKESGHLEVRRAMEVAVAHLGISRATAYNDIK